MVPFYRATLTLSLVACLFAGACGDDRRGALCRELTKLHEQVRRGTLIDLAVGAAADPPRGEVTIVVAGETRPAGWAGDGQGGAGVDVASRASDLAAARERVARLVADGSTRSAAAKEVARETGLPRRELFHDPEDDS